MLFREGKEQEHGEVEERREPSPKRFIRIASSVRRIAFTRRRADMNFVPLPHRR